MKCYDNSNFSRASVVQFRASRYIMCLNRKSESKVMLIWTCFALPFLISRYILLVNLKAEWKVRSIRISREPPLFNFKHIDIFLAWISIRVKSYGFLNLPCASTFIFEHLDIFCSWIGYPSERFWPFQFLECFRFSIFSVSKYYWPESDIRVKNYARLNLACASMFNFENLHILCS